MYYAFIENNNIIGKGQCPCSGDNIFSVEITEEVYNDIDRYIYADGEIIINPNYEQEQADLREVEFKKNFFEIDNIGWYRKVPKGYSSAIESLNTAFNRFILMQKMGVEEFPANVFIFYQAPDFSKPEECTEEWLIEHQFRNQAMSVLEFGQFYTSFTNAWNNQEHEVQNDV